MEVKGNILEQLFPMQEYLMNEWVKAGKLKPFPVEDINSKTDQALVKDLISCFVEELGEAYNALEQVYTYASDNNLPEALKHLADYNEEIADANHFMLEVFVYLGYAWEDIDIMVKNLCEQINHTYIEERPFKTLMNMAYFINSEENRGIHKGTPFRLVLEEEAYGEQAEHLAGGRRIDYEKMQQHQQLLWAVTAQWFKVRNSLKNRAWTSTVREVNYRQLEDELIRALLTYVVYLEFAGFTERSLVVSYSKANQKNINRIKNGY